MSAIRPADERADRIAARATGFGAGLIAFMITWLISARITERIFEAATGAYVAMGLAVIAGVIITIRTSQRLIHGLDGAQLSSVDK